MLPNDNYNMMEIAKLESAITGIIAGFALTIVVLLIERLASRSSDIHYDATLGRAAITVFITTFFTSILASYLFAVNAAEIKNSPRAFMMVMPPAFVFALSAILLMFGIVLLLGAYKLDHALEPAKTILYVTIVIALFHYAYTALEVIAVMHRIPLPDFFALPRYLLPAVLMPLLSLVFGLSLKWRRFRKRNVQFDLQGFQEFIIFCIITSTLVGMIESPISSASPELVLPVWQVFLFVAGLSIVAGWSLLYIPNSTET